MPQWRSWPAARITGADLSLFSRKKKQDELGKSSLSYCTILYSIVIQ